MSDIAFSDLQESKPFRLEKSGKAICVVKVGQEVFAIDDTCSHSDASLSEGDVEKFAVECWLHGAAFDLRTGEAVSMPATENVKSYPVHVDGDSVTIEI
ncbi:MAG: non-heme iron oxygenase ferredoxin subunit [Actinomycetes bacterium]